MSEERDPKVSRRYRELASEEPPRELDRTILAAAHRAAGRPHAPLVTPAGRHRWYFAFGAAAILVLAVAITVHMERSGPDPEAVVPQERGAPAPSPPKPDYAPAESPAKENAARDAARAEARRAPLPPASQDAVPAAPSPQQTEPAERWMERILQLRKEGKHEEAAKQLAEFRRSYPDYKIPASALK